MTTRPPTYFTFVADYTTAETTGISAQQRDAHITHPSIRNREQSFGEEEWFTNIELQSRQAPFALLSVNRYNRY